MALYNPTVRICATCAYWGGNRQAVNLGANASVENGAEGSCQYPLRRNIHCKESGACQFWDKWPALR
jgi:hypothetical protein